MASAVQVIGVGTSDESLRRAERRVRALEARWSRFLASSELSALNAATDDWVAVSRDTIVLVDAMQRGLELGGGHYDPTLLHEVIAVGYRSSIDDDTVTGLALALPDRSRTLAEVVIDHEGSAIWMPAGLALDPGGIGKGLAADLVALELVADGASGALVSIGGDLAAVGTPPSADGWRIRIADPENLEATQATITIDGGGVATSSTRIRRFDNGRRHHLIDPVTGRSSTSDLMAATVVGPSGWQAEVHATTALLLGSVAGREHLDRHGLWGSLTPTRIEARR